VIASRSLKKIDIPEPTILPCCRHFLLDNDSSSLKRPWTRKHVPVLQCFKV